MYITDIHLNLLNNGRKISGLTNIHCTNDDNQMKHCYIHYPFYMDALIQIEYRLIQINAQAQVNPDRESGLRPPSKVVYRLHGRIHH